MSSGVMLPMSAWMTWPTFCSSVMSRICSSTRRSSTGSSGRAGASSGHSAGCSWAEAAGGSGAPVAGSMPQNASHEQPAKRAPRLHGGRARGRRAVIGVRGCTGWGEIHTVMTALSTKGQLTCSSKHDLPPRRIPRTDSTRSES